MEQITELNINKIIPNPKQPRKEFDNNKIQELASSIKENGLINPIQVKQDKGRYIIVCGERRWKAHKLLKLKKIKAIIKTYNSEQEEMAESLVENLHRTDLTSVERENYIYKLWKTGTYKTFTELGKAVGFSKETIRINIHSKELRDKLNIPKEIPTSVLKEVDRLKNMQDIKKVLNKYNKGEVTNRKMHTYLRVVKNSPDDVRKALYSNQLSLEQAEKTSKIASDELRKQVISAHKDIKNIDKKIDKDIEEIKKENKPNTINIKEGISNFRFNCLETQRQIQTTMNSLGSCFKHIQFMDNEQSKQLRYYQELLEVNLTNSLAVFEKFKEKSEELA